MEDYYYDSTVEFLQSFLEMAGDNLVYGCETMNNFVKEYDPIKFPVVNAGAQGVSCTGCGGSGGSGPRSV